MRGADAEHGAADHEEARAGGFRAGVRKALPILPPSFALGVSFGVLASSIGWGWVAPIVASLVVFSGSAQFALASVLGAGGSVAAALGAAAMVNARFVPLGIALAPALHGGRWRKAIEAQANVDASWILAARGDGTFDRDVLFGATAVQYVGWSAGTALGAVAGNVIGNPESYGLDAMAPAFFLALLLPELGDDRRRLAAALSAALALALIPVVPAGIPIVAACVVALVGLRP